MTILIRDWQINPELGTIADTTSKQVHKVEPKTMAVLLLLIDKQPHVVTREAFMQTVWNGSFTVEESLTRCISELRRAFGDNPKSPEYIKTIHKKGYQLLIEPIDEVSNVATVNISQVPPKKQKAPFYISLFSVGLLITLIWGWSKWQSEADGVAATNKIDIPTQRVLPVAQANSIKDKLLSPQESGSEWVFSKELDDKKFEIVVTMPSQNNGDVQQINIQVNDSSNTPIWEAKRDFNSVQQRTAAANDLIKALGFLQSSKQVPELGLLSVELQQQYKQAIYLMDKRGKENLNKSLALLENILEQQSGFVMAVVQQAVATRLLALYETESENRKQAIIKFNLLLKQAKSIEPEHPVVKAVTMRFDTENKNWQEYEDTLKASVSYAPGCTICVRTLAEFYLNIGYFEKAAATVEEHLDYFPLSVFMHSFLGIVYSQQGSIAKVEYQADVIDALGNTKGFDAMSLRVQVAMMEGDKQMLDELHETLLEVHPVYIQHIKVNRAIMDKRFEEAKALIGKMRMLDFNLGVSSGMLDEVIERIEKNVSYGQLRDLSLTHGWLMPDSYIFDSYSKNSLALKNRPEIVTLFEEIGLFDFWKQNNQWPDYCLLPEYKRHRPLFCPSMNTENVASIGE